MVNFFTILKKAHMSIQIIYLGNELEQLQRIMYLKRLTHELIIGKLLQIYLEITVTPSSLQVHLKTYRPINDWEKYLPPAPYYLHDVDALSLLQKQATKRYRDRNSINFIMRSGLLCYFDLPKLHFNGSPHIHCSKF